MKRLGQALPAQAASENLNNSEPDFIAHFIDPSGGIRPPHSRLLMSE
jgi:hypothetical protein